MRTNEEIIKEFIDNNPTSEKHREALVAIAKAEDWKKAIMLEIKKHEMRRILR